MYVERTRQSNGNESSGFRRSRPQYHDGYGDFKDTVRIVR